MLSPVNPPYDALFYRDGISRNSMTAATSNTKDKNFAEILLQACNTKDDSVLAKNEFWAKTAAKK